jgi:transposase
LKKKHHEARIIVVADKGLNTSQNVSQIRENGDGYIFSQMIRGPKGKRYSEALFDEIGWIHSSNNYKYKMYLEEINGHQQKVLLYWSKKEYDLARAKREEKIQKALKSLSNNVFGIRHGYEKYLMDGLMDENTGEYYTKETLKSKRILDIDKIKEDEKFDGYSCLISSELQFSENEIRKYYHELWEIEETFRITKTDLKFRPLFHYKKSHITVHFMICYTALLVIRLFQYKLKEHNIHLSAERIIRVLNKLNLDQPSVGFVHLHQIGGFKAFGQNNQFSGVDEVFNDYKLINVAFGIDFNRAIEREEKFMKFINSIIFA